MQAEAVIYVGDLARMRAFYEQCFGLVAADSADGYCGLQSPAWLLTLVQSDEARPDTAPPRRRSQTAVKLVIEVGSIAAVRARAAGLGGQVSPRDREWTFRDAVRCDAVDPEGNVVQLIEGAAA